MCDYLFLGAFCETKLKSECEKGFVVPGVGLCGPCTCKTEENFNATCDKNGNLPNSFPGKCFCKVIVRLYSVLKLVRYKKGMPKVLLVVLGSIPVWDRPKSDTDRHFY